MAELHDWLPRDTAMTTMSFRARRIPQLFRVRRLVPAVLWLDVNDTWIYAGIRHHGRTRTHLWQICQATPDIDIPDRTITIGHDRDRHNYSLHLLPHRDLADLAVIVTALTTIHPPPQRIETRAAPTSPGRSDRTAPAERRTRVMKTHLHRLPSYKTGKHTADQYYTLSRAVRARGHFPNEQAALKCLYLVTRSLDPTGGGRARWLIRWKPALNAFAITFAGRFERTTY
jgi:hypothetical protein